MKKKEFSSIYKTCLLAALCAICGLVLAIINEITAPKIAENAIAAVKSNLEEIFPHGTFKDVSEQYKTKDKKGYVTAVYEAKDKGLAFTLSVPGYNADGFTFILGFNNDGSVAGYGALEQNETKGKGSKAFDKDYVDKVKKLTSKDTVELISGATVTTTGVSEGFDAAKAIFNEIKGISYDPNAKAKPKEKPKAKALKDEDFSSNAASCSVKSKDGTTIIYSCKAKGFENESAATITVDTSNKTVKKVVVDSFGDTKGVGDLAISEEALKRYAGVNEQSNVEVVSGATFTSTGIKAMVYKALQMTGK